MVSLSYRIALKMIKLSIALFLKLNIHYMTNTQKLQPSKYITNNYSFNLQLFLYEFGNPIILFDINYITTFS